MIGSFIVCISANLMLLVLKRVNVFYMYLYLKRTVMIGTLLEDQSGHCQNVDSLLESDVLLTKRLVHLNSECPHVIQLVLYNSSSAMLHGVENSIFGGFLE